MAEAITTSGRLDERGRISVPANIRKALGVGPGDTVFLRYEPRENQVYIAPAANPFDILAEKAIEEYRAGKTRTTEQFARSQDIKTDE